MRKIFNRQKVWSEKQLARAIVQALVLWGDEQYARFLKKSTPGRLDQEWFNWFVGKWAVARTVKAKKRNLVRKYLAKKFRRKIPRRKLPIAIDKAADFIQKKKWSPRVGKGKQSSRPISLASKIGFLFRPNRIVPFDGSACKGLSVIRGSKKDGGEGHLGNDSYSAYFSAFNEKYKLNSKQIINELKSKWVSGLAEELGCKTNLSSAGLQRKVFDNLLMQIGAQYESDEMVRGKRSRRAKQHR